MERYYIATLHAINLIGHQSVRKLVEIFGSAENVWRSEISQLKESNFNPKMIENLIEFRSKFPDAVEKLVKFCEVKKVKICTYYDEEYPPILKEISGAPVVFYHYGELKPEAKRVSMVGTRNPTDYGKKVALKLGEELAAAGLTVVSGAARGIDTFSHQAALKVGRTVAVLGYGINKMPSYNRKLFEDIVENGGVVMTEFPPNFEGDKGTFPARNRIIAGLSKSLVVVEAGERSGALITAGFAADFSREVFVVPNSIFSDKSAGCHKLINDGAFLLTSSADVLECYNLQNKKTAPKIEPEVKLEGAEKIIYDAIPNDAEITLDEILMSVDEVSPAEIAEIMLSLELKGYIVENDDKYSRK